MSTLKSALFATLLNGTPLSADTRDVSVNRQLSSLSSSDHELMWNLAEEVRHLLAHNGFAHASVSSRVKSAGSVLAKMRRKSLSLSEITDRIGLRIIVATEDECYAVRALLLGQTREKPSESDDYIANPKPNGYRSLHMALYAGPAGEIAEIQVRTAEMHAHAESGGAAHWKYKIETGAPMELQPHTV